MSRLPLALLLALFMHSAVALDDPMRPPGGGAVATGTTTAVTRFVLDSTLIAHERRSAVINGRNVSVGDTVDGARVVEIEPAQVRLLHQGQQIILQLLPVAVKQPRTTE